MLILALGFKIRISKNCAIKFKLTDGINEWDLGQITALVFLDMGPPCISAFFKSNFATSATWRLGKKSSYIKNILGFSYLHAYTTFAPRTKLKFEKSSKSSHPNIYVSGNLRNSWIGISPKNTFGCKYIQVLFYLLKLAFKICSFRIWPQGKILLEI